MRIEHKSGWKNARSLPTEMISENFGQAPIKVFYEGEGRSNIRDGLPHLEREVEPLPVIARYFPATDPRLNELHRYMGGMLPTPAVHWSPKNS
jgi:hypothetical protein